MKEKIGQLKDSIKDKDDEIDSLKDELRKAKEPQNSTNKTTEDAVDNSEANAEDIKNRFKDLLKQSTLSFNDVTWFYSQVSKDPGWNALDTDTKKQIESYYNVCRTLANGNSEDITKIMDPNHSDSKELTREHKWLVLANGYGT